MFNRPSINKEKLQIMQNKLIKEYNLTKTDLKCKK